MFSTLFSIFSTIEDVFIFIFFLRFVPKAVTKRAKFLTGFLKRQTGRHYIERDIEIAADNAELILPLFNDHTLSSSDANLEADLISYNKECAKEYSSHEVFCAINLIPSQKYCCDKPLTYKAFANPVVFRYGKPAVKGILYRSSCPTCKTEYNLNSKTNRDGTFYHDVTKDEFIAFSTKTAFENRLLRSFNLDL